MTRAKAPKLVVSALLVYAALTFRTHRADASLDATMSVDDLARRSSAIAVVTPLEQHSEWEGGRIVTLSRVRVDSLVAGALPTESVVRTLGGVQGNLAQRVEGEPELVPGESCLLFVHLLSSGILRISARAQGQFVFHRDDAGRFVLAKSPHLGHLVRRAGFAGQNAADAVSALHGVLFDSVAGALHETWERTHAR